MDFSPSGLNKRTLPNLLLCWLAVTLLAGADTPKGPGTQAPSPAPGQLQYEQPIYLTGAILDPDTKQLLFNFKRVATRTGSTLKVQRDFSYPDGKLAARERVVYEGNSLLSYELEETQIGAAGSARIRHARDNPLQGSIDFQYTPQAGSSPKVRTETLRQNTLLADMVGPFLTAHWDALLRGEKLKCRYIVVPRRETVGFTFLRDSLSTHQGRAVVIVKMKPTSRFVAALVAPLYFTIEQAPPHRVLQYVGRTTPKIQVDGKWKDLDAITVFDWNSAR